MGFAGLLRPSRMEEQEHWRYPWDVEVGLQVVRGFFGVSKLLWISLGVCEAKDSWVSQSEFHPLLVEIMTDRLKGVSSA